MTWTVDTLKEYMEKRLEAADKAVGAALASSDKATAKAEAAANIRADAQNEFRQAMKDQQLNYPTREELSPRFDTIDAQLRALVGWRERMEGARTGLSAGWGVIVGSVGIVVGVIGAIVLLVNAFKG